MKAFMLTISAARNALPATQPLPPFFTRFDLLLARLWLKCHLVKDLFMITLFEVASFCLSLLNQSIYFSF